MCVLRKSNDSISKILTKTDIAVQWFGKLYTAKIREFGSAVLQLLWMLRKKPRDRYKNWQRDFGAFSIDVKGNVFNLLSVPFWNRLGAHMRKHAEPSNCAIYWACSVWFISVRFTIYRTSTLCTALGLRCVEIKESFQHKIWSDSLKRGSLLLLSGTRAAKNMTNAYEFFVTIAYLCE